MIVCSILNTLPIDDNTAVVVEGSRDLFRSGTGVLDENGKPYVVLSARVGNNMSLAASKPYFNITSSCSDKSRYSTPSLPGESVFRPGMLWNHILVLLSY